jgi:hypothetical protein
MDMDDDNLQVSFVIECTEDIAIVENCADEPAKARQKLLDKSVGTPKDKQLCKSFKQMCDFATGSIHSLPQQVKTHLGGV